MRNCQFAMCLCVLVTGLAVTAISTPSFAYRNPPELLDIVSPTPTVGNCTGIASVSSKDNNNGVAATLTTLALKTDSSVASFNVFSYLSQGSPEGPNNGPFTASVGGIDLQDFLEGSCKLLDVIINEVIHQQQGSSQDDDANTWQEGYLSEIVFTGTQASDGRTYTWTFSATAVPGNANPNTVANLVAHRVEVTRTSAVFKNINAVNQNFYADRADLITANDPTLAGRLVSRAASGRFADTDGQALIATGLMLTGLDGHGISDASPSARLETGLHQIITAAAGQSAQSQYGLGVDRAQFGLATANDVALPRYDVWMKGRYQRVKANGRDGDFALLHMGADYLVNPDLLIGAIVQMDIFDQTDSDFDASAKGVGWLAGPYVVTRLTDAVVFEGRAAWGQSDNNIKPFNTYTDNVDTHRWLLKGALSGEFNTMDWQFAPAASVYYFHEKQKAYTDMAGYSIDSQTVKLGRLKFGPTVSRIMTLPNGARVMPSFTFEGLWDFETTGHASISGQTLTSDDLRARAEGGVTFWGPGDVAFTLTGNYDGIGSDDLEAYGGSAEVNIPF